MTGNKIIIENVKGIKHLEFEFPGPGVHVISATNGSGKTSLLVCIEKIVNTRAFNDNFLAHPAPNVNFYSDAKITYANRNGSQVTYTHRSTSDQWRANVRTSNPLSNIYSQIIYLPTLGERVLMKSGQINGRTVRLVDRDFREAMAEILEDERFLGLRKANIGETRGRSGANRRANTSFFLRCRNRSTASQSYFYTENSFSLGELFTLNMVFQIRNIPEGSLLLVDELEVALHPRVQYKLLKFLEKIALERNLTILVSTHSSSLIKSANNLIFLEKDDSGLTNVVYNCYPTYALREVAILEDITPDYVFYVEDVMAERYLRQLIQKYFQLTQQSVMPLWKVMPIGGYPEVLKFGKKSKDYLLPDFIGQYLFLDQDVVFNKEELRAKGNARSLKEQMLWQLFQELDLRTRYLYITPELGLFEWIITSTADLSTRITNDYPDRIIDLREVLAQCSAAFPQTANNLREAAKNKLSWLAKELGGQLGLTLDRFYDEIFKFYCADVLSRPIKQGELRALFGPIFNRRGNPS